MGSLMALLAIPDGSLIADAVRGQLRKTDRGRGRGSKESSLYEASGRGGILRERL